MSRKVESERKLKRSFTITPEADRMLAVLAQKMGLSKASVVEIAVRRLADNEQVKPEA